MSASLATLGIEAVFRDDSGNRYSLTKRKP